MDSWGDTLKSQTYKLWFYTHHRKWDIKWTKAHISRFCWHLCLSLSERGKIKETCFRLIPSGEVRTHVEDASISPPPLHPAGSLTWRYSVCLFCSFSRWFILIVIAAEILPARHQRWLTDGSLDTGGRERTCKWQISAWCMERETRWLREPINFSYGPSHFYIHYFSTLHSFRGSWIWSEIWPGDDLFAPKIILVPL